VARKITFDSTLSEGDKAFAYRMGALVEESLVARHSYTRLQQQGTDVILVNDRNMGELGLFDRAQNKVTINLARHSSPEEFVSTLVHESAHQTRYFRGFKPDNIYEEYFAFRREFLFNNGRRPSLVERQQLWNEVQQMYSDLPVGRIPVQSWGK